MYAGSLKSRIDLKKEEVRQSNAAQYDFHIYLHNLRQAAVFSVRLCCDALGYWSYLPDSVRFPVSHIDSLDRPQSISSRGAVVRLGAAIQWSNTLEDKNLIGQNEKIFSDRL